MIDQYDGVQTDGHFSVKSSLPDILQKRIRQLGGMVPSQLADIKLRYVPSSRTATEEYQKNYRDLRNAAHEIESEHYKKIHYQEIPKLATVGLESTESAESDVL